MSPSKMVSQHVATAQQVAADAAAGISVASAGFAWLETANGIAQLVASIIAAVAGVAAIWWHVDRILEARRERARRASEGGD